MPTIQPLDAFAPPTSNIGDGSLSPEEANLNQHQVDELGLGGQIGRGWDTLGEFMFGEKSALHDTAIPDIFGGAGAILGGVGNLGVVKPLEAGATVLHAVPLGWLPGGADESFGKIGEWAKANDPTLYAQWQAVDAAAAGQWGAGDLHADFNTMALQYLDDQHKDSALGASPTLAIGRAGVGSLGDAFTDAVGGWLGLAGNEAQLALGNAGIFDPSSARVTYDQSVEQFAANPDSLPPDNRYAMEQLAAGKFTEAEARAYIDKNAGGRDRVTEAAARLDRGDDVSDIEKQAVEAYRSGAWSLEHAQQWLVSHGQGVTRNPIGQLVASAATDPLTYASIGAGAIAKAGLKGSAIATTGMDAASAYDRFGATVNAIQKFQVANHELGPVFRFARGLIDPLAVYKPSAVQRATTDLLSGTAVTSFGRTYGPATGEVRAIGREFGMTTEVDSAIASYSMDKAYEMVASTTQRRMLAEGLGEELVQSNVDDVVRPLAERAGRDAVTELTDYMTDIAKNTFSAEDEANLAGRLAATFGNDVAYWQKRMETMSHDLKSSLHVVTYKRFEVEFQQARAIMDDAAYAGDLPLRNMVPMTSETLDNVVAQDIIDNIRTALKAEPDELAAPIKAVTEEWNGQAHKYPQLANIGWATGGKTQVEKLVAELEKKLQSGGITRRATAEELTDPIFQPIRDVLDRHSVQLDRIANVLDDLPAEESKALWRVGFRPDEEVAWGLKRDVNTGRYIVDRAPTISHVIDAVPGRQPFSDTTRNVLGQVIGKAKAERINKPIDAIEAMTNTMRDQITGRRLVNNIERRFERSTFAAGIPKPLAKEIYAKAREVAGLEFTTVRGIRPDNLWNAIHDSIPRNLVLKDGSALNVHIAMDHLLQAAEGDLRIMGITSVLSQRMRNALRKLGDGSNWSGQMTVTLYNKVRYSQPMFLIQRVTDAPYYSILHGVTPVGKGVLTGSKAELEKITENLGRTGMARDFSMDMPEYATRANFTAGIKSQLQQAGLKENRYQRIIAAPDTIIANNMTNMLHARLGNIVRGTLDNLASAAEKADPAFKADMLAAGETLTNSFEDWRRIYSQNAGRVLSDDEVGLQYIKDQLNAWRRHTVLEDGKLDFSRLIAEGERSMPDAIADIGPIKPDILAVELGFTDAAHLRREVVGHVEKINGEFQLVPGSLDVPALEEMMRTNLNAHPDYIRRATAYFGESWDDFWSRLARGTDEGGLDISKHYAKEAQDLIAVQARDRGMDPWEYLSGVMASNIGAKDLSTHMGQLVSFLKSGKSKQPLEQWTKMFRATLDPSAQRTLLDEFAAATNTPLPAGVVKPAEFTFEVPKSAPGKAARPPVAKLPDTFATEKGYVYRVENPEAVLSGWPARTGVTTGKPTAFYHGKGGTPEAIFRTKADDTALTAGRHGAGGADRLTKGATAPENIEMLGADGQWHPLAADPYDLFFETQFPEAVRERIISGVPHPNPEVESYMQALSKWVQDALGPELGSRTRADLRRLVEAVPTTQASSFNRTQALVVSLLKNKIEDAQQDVFRLAEMQTQRSVLERSLNHPLFGLYPASYMWGKVLPESVKFFARNPYAATYAIADVQRSIAIQREYNPDMEETMNGVDRSAAAFLMDYLTPGLPWNAHDARMSPMVRELLKGKPEDVWLAELRTVSPERWISSIVDSGKEALDFAHSLQAEDTINPLPDLSDITGTPAIPLDPNATTQPITGPTKAGALAPILADDLSRLQSILLNGESAEE